MTLCRCQQSICSICINWAISFFKVWLNLKLWKTRRHSSRMHTICLGWGVWRGEGCMPRGCLSRDCAPRWVSAWWGRVPKGVSARGCLLSLWIESQTGVKTLPCCNYVADGKNCVQEINLNLRATRLPTPAYETSPTTIMPRNMNPICLSLQGGAGGSHRYIENRFIKSVICSKLSSIHVIFCFITTLFSGCAVSHSSVRLLDFHCHGVISCLKWIVCSGKKARF